MRLSADGLPPLREVVAAHGLDARKALGQNFLFDLNLTARIARAAGPLDQTTVVEIGPGVSRVKIGDRRLHGGNGYRTANILVGAGEIAQHPDLQARSVGPHLPWQHRGGSGGAQHNPS